MKQRYSRRQFLHHVAGAAVAAGGLAIASCVSKEPAATAPTAAPTSGVATAVKAVSEIVIGAVYPLTGPSAPNGVDSVNGYKLATEVINGKFDLDLPLAKTEGLTALGGVPVRFIFGDHQSSPEKGMSETERLITQEKVVAVCGCWQSGVTAPASEAAERYKTPFLIPDAASPSLMNRGFKWLFRISNNTETFIQNELMSLFMVDLQKKANVKIKKIALLYENSLSGADFIKYCRQYGEPLGYEFEEVAYPPKTTSMGAETQRLKQINADIVLSGTYLAEGILFRKTWKELDYNPPLHFENGGHRNKQFLETLGVDAYGELQNDEFSLDYAQARPLVKTVNDLFKERFGQDLNTESSRAFMGAMVIAEAVNRAGTTNSEDIRAALRAAKWGPQQTITTWGGIEFDPETGQNKLGRYCFHQVMVEEGKPVWRLVWPFEDATVPIVYPVPKWSERKYS